MTNLERDILSLSQDIFGCFLAFHDQIKYVDILSNDRYMLVETNIPNCNLFVMRSP